MQEVYSGELGHVVVVAENHDELDDRFERIIETPPIDIDT